MKQFYLICLAIITLALSGCFGRVERQTNYYVLDYQKATEKPELVMEISNQKSLYVMNSRINRIYNRNQIVAKESFSQVRFMYDDLWANRLSDAVPNIISDRLKAYNIFDNVYRNALETDPDYYLETSVLNIEKIEGANPRAYLRMEFVLRDSTSERTVLSYRNDHYRKLSDDSIVYLVQVFNEMIMNETNAFASLCIMHFAGKPIDRSKRDFTNMMSAPTKYFFQHLEDQEAHKLFGELLLNTKAPVSSELQYKVEGVDSLNTKISEAVGEYNVPLLLEPGNYRVITGYNEDIKANTVVFPRLRTVHDRIWSELRVRILDDSQTRVRMIYDLWVQNEDDYGYTKVGSDISRGEDEHGIEESLWILPPGNYMITLGGNSWSTLRDFATVYLQEGDSPVMTVIVDTSPGASNLLIGAGVLADELGVGQVKFHKGAIHANLNISSNNEVDEKDPSFTLNLAGQFDNTIDHEFRPFHYNMRSIYDIGANFNKDSDARINKDNYSLKNTLLLYPWKKEKKFFNNLAFYGRADLNTHFWDEYTHFSDPKNYIVIDYEGSEIERALNQDKIRTKIALYPLRLKEGTGLTYRIAFSPSTWVSMRSGYGWVQDINRRSLSSASSVTIDGINYDVFTEAENRYDRGIETTLIFSSVNILRFLSINSTFDALFPFEDSGIMPSIENENRINFRIYRNISLDVSVNLKYDKAIKDWLVYDYTSYLRMSLFY
ncbi:MAG: ABC-type transport auxiliary lipoprotein family protein [Candidatus Cloacimonadaceae bacterium]|nr:PqiC family protein [Candidatus Cloacimonadota bacterium]MCB5255028.1 PqiC family protein [Candidatus Cloacimonadota bacterium]MCK9178031.1 PqiC family protein [Candidatus Cloacimonadota bacterium]MCK9241877.1 PqiC family protein [Candidatus Cloacimonadota bacterium]MDD3532836.1 ABC-type transport auxiliary lipoprotein family protein [Candidatus Cloacimonadota bacterium]